MPPDATPHDDTDLVVRCLGGDELAFEILFLRYRDPLYGYALRMLKNATEAEEASIEIIEKVFSSLHTFRQTEAFRPWLYAIARNECLLRLRRSRKAVQLDLARLAAGEKIQSPDHMELAEQAAALRSQVDALDEPYRETVILAYYQGLTSREVADVLGANENTVRTRLARALRMLREKLDENIDEKP